MAAGGLVWVGAENGALKEVNLRRKQATNHVCGGGGLNRSGGVCALGWADPAEREILVACRDRFVHRFSTESGKFCGGRRCPGGEGPFCGVAALRGSIVTCVESGVVTVWREDGTEDVTIQAGPRLSRMRQHPQRPQRLGTGGRDNALKLWDLQRPQEPLFSAKNVRNDWLDLRVPVWDRDLAFLPHGDKVVTCTAHRQRRPVLEATFGEGALSTLALGPTDTSVIVGSARGEIGVIDLRKGRLLRSLKGVAGGVRGLLCPPPDPPLVVSCGLDRFLRVHDLRGGALRSKVYLKSPLTCLLLSSRHPWQDEEEPPPPEEPEEGGGDALWDALETVPTSPKRGTKRKALGP
ncbi:WD repeat-containing protein 74 isoform X2 [Patagioenas fasciata]|uniref:WD repeat-containing protein 74 isoform X2 n=1 Tax=Patagioenas fasciata TaxID=372321 RepID=UPI003A98EF67